jgi:hypothetical protein
MKLTLKRLNKLQDNAKRFTDLYGSSPYLFDPDGPPTPSETVALVQEVLASRSATKKPTKKAVKKDTKLRKK